MAASITKWMSNCGREFDTKQEAEKCETFTSRVEKLSKVIKGLSILDNVVMDAHEIVTFRAQLLEALDATPNEMVAQ